MVGGPRDLEIVVSAWLVRGDEKEELRAKDAVQ
jgi:hypothetical protein